MTRLGKVAIIGANGFIGSRLVELFHLGGVAELAPIVRSPASLAKLARFDLDWRLADAVDRPTLAQALAGCELVVHAVVGDPRTIGSAAAALVPAAAQAGVRRIVYLSTASVHGQNPAAGTDESSALCESQEFDYNNAKVAAERRVRADARRLGVELIALRPSVVFGPRDRWVATIAAELQRGTAWLVEGGAGVCNSVYVDNLVEAIRLALTAPVSGAEQTYLITDDERVTWAQFYEELRRLLGAAAPVLQVSVPPLRSNRWRRRWGALHGSPAAQAVIARVPARWKRLVKTAVNAWPEPARRSDWILPAKSPLPRMEAEWVRLQQCGWQLPCTAARRDLGYRPLVSTAEGLARTVAWLEWAGWGRETNR